MTIFRPDLPDFPDTEPSSVLCPTCFKATHYALNTHRYVCPTHGPVMTGEALEAFCRAATGR